MQMVRRGLFRADDSNKSAIRRVKSLEENFREWLFAHITAYRFCLYLPVSALARRHQRRHRAQRLQRSRPHRRRSQPHADHRRTRANPLRHSSFHFPANPRSLPQRLPPRHPLSRRVQPRPNTRFRLRRRPDCLTPTPAGVQAVRVQAVRVVPAATTPMPLRTLALR